MSLIADFELGLCTRTHDHAVSSRAPNLKLQKPQKTLKVINVFSFLSSALKHLSFFDVAKKCVV
jgi:hypothetical protein